MRGFWGRRSGAGHASQAPIQGQGTRFNANYQFTWQAQRLPDPGVQNYAYTNLGLAEFSPIGDAVANRKHFRPFSTPLFAGQAIPTTGIGGLSAGQIIFQPLIDPSSDDGST